MTDVAAHDLTRRLEALPWSRRHSRLLVGSGLGWALDAMDVGLISFVIAQLMLTWPDQAGGLAWVASAGFAGMAIGASLGGLLADRIGRRQVFAVTLLVYGIATGLSGLAASVAVLIALRFVVGLGLGAELPVASTLVSEYAPARIRGRVVVLLEAFWAIGWTFAALIGYFVIPSSDDGWRWALALGAVPAVYAVVVRLGLPESVRFLVARGRRDEAEEIVRRWEAGAGRLSHAPAPSVVRWTDPDAVGTPNAVGAVDEAAVTAPGRAGVAGILSPGLRRRTITLWVVWFCVNFSYYGAFIWLPTLFVNAGTTLTRSFGYTLVITLAQLPGYLVAAWLVERWGRRRTLAAFLFGSGVSAVAFGAVFFVDPSATGLILAAGCALSFCNLGAWGALYAVTPEVFPTAVRATGAGWAAGVGRIASILAPLSVPVMLPIGGTVLVFAVFGVFFVIAAAGALGLPERAGRTLD